jgi:hypothetical protein
MTKPRMAAATVLSLVAYLVLAIAGAGGAARFFSYPPLITVTIVTIALGFAVLFSEGHIGSGVREDRSNRWVSSLPHCPWSLAFRLRNSCSGRPSARDTMPIGPAPGVSFLASTECSGAVAPGGLIP